MLYVYVLKKHNIHYQKQQIHIKTKLITNAILNVKINKNNTIDDGNIIVDIVIVIVVLVVVWDAAPTIVQG